MKRNMILAALAAATVLGVIGCCGTKDVKVETIKKKCGVCSRGGRKGLRED